MNKAKYLAVCYADIFDFPLTMEEVEKWQIKQKHKNYNRYKIFNSFNYYYLPGREKLVALRKLREKFSREKLLLAKKTGQLLAKIPFIKLMAVSGALAMQNSGREDDIDILLITEKNRIWTTRFLAILFLELTGQRRRPNDKRFGNKICLNMFLDESHLEIPKEARNLYVAHEVCQIKPLYNKNRTYERFLEKNKWVKSYLPFALSLSLRVPPAGGRSNLKHGGVLGFILDILEFLFFKIQYFYMKSKITRETVEKNRILFHPRDTAKIVLEEFRKRVG